MVHSEKTLKNRLKNLLPNEASIKLFYDQNGPKAHESLLLKLYHFDDIPKTEFQRILSNPLYFLGNQRNLRMFRFYLMKSGFSQNKVSGKFERKDVKSRKTSLVSNGQNLLQFQFTDKTKVNYQEPWKYIDNTIKNIEAQSKDLGLSVQNKKPSQRKYSSIIQLSKEQFKSPKNEKKGNESPQTTKSLSTSFIFKIKERERNTSRVKENLFISQLKKSNSLRVSFFSKILDSEMRVKKMKENSAIERQKMQSESLLKSTNYQVKKLKFEKEEPQMKRHLSQLRLRCLKSESLTKLENAVPLAKVKQMKAKQRKQVLKNLLEKRLGIENSTPELKIANPQGSPQTLEFQKSIIFQ